MNLFDLEIPKNTAPIEDVEITTTILYMSKPELKTFKTLAKKGIKAIFGADFQTKGNITDLLLYLLKKEYGSTINLPGVDNSQVIPSEPQLVKENHYK